MVIGDNDNKIPYKITLSKLVYQLMESICANFCISMTFIHCLISKNMILRTFFIHCNIGIKYGRLRTADGYIISSEWIQRKNKKSRNNYTIAVSIYKILFYYNY